YQAQVFAHQAMCDRGKQVEALLRDKAGDDRRKRAVQVPFWKPKLAQQSTFALAFAGQVIDRIGPRDVAVGFRVPLGVIHTVDDSSDWPVLAKERIQPKAQFLGLNLLRVTFTHRAYGVAPRNAAFEQIHFSEELELIRIEKPAVQADLRKNLRR